jgi:hypothetical protein
MGNACDPDDDNDTIPDAVDNCPLLENGPRIAFESNSNGNLVCTQSDPTGLA